MMVVICGVSGSGKTTVGNRLASKLGIPFYDADDFHPAANIKKLSQGNPLDDDDRQPWLETLADQMAIWEKQDGAVLGCSALKETYRQTLVSKCSAPIHWARLTGSRALLKERVEARTDHFLDPSILASQFETLERPDYGWTFDVSPPPEKIVNSILARLNGSLD